MQFELHNQYFDVAGKVKDKDWFTVSGKGSVELRHKEGIVAITLFGMFMFRVLVMGGSGKAKKS